MSEVFHNMGMPMKSLSAEFGLPYPNTRPQLWEEYVKRFIEHYKLNSDQQQKAWSIHKSCKERAENYLTKRKRDFERLQKDELDLQKMPETSDKRKTMTKVIKRRTELLEPITKIFENELKPRLQKLLTRRQLKEASSYKPKKGEE